MNRSGKEQVMTSNFYLYKLPFTQDRSQDLSVLPPIFNMTTNTSFPKL